MRRNACVLFLLTSPSAFAAESVRPFWHLSEHGDSLLLIALGLFIVRRECLKALYPDRPLARRSARVARLSIPSIALAPRGGWGTHLALWQARLRRAVLGRFH